MADKIKKTLNLLTTVLTVIVIIVAVLLVGVRLFGLTPYTILSGSMEPTYHVGSLIYVVDVEPEELKIGDPLTYIIAGGTVVTHRIIDIVYDEEEPGVIRFQTQGDNNDIPDGSLVHENNVVGKPVFTIPYLGYVSSFIQNPPGSYFAVAVCLLLVLMAFLPDYFIMLLGKKETSSDEEGGEKENVGADGENEEIKANEEVKANEGSDRE